METTRYCCGYPDKQASEIAPSPRRIACRMLSTGDVSGALRQLDTLLRTLSYPERVDYQGLSRGAPSAFLPIISFVLTSFSPPVAEQLLAAGLQLSGKSDLRFTQTFYKVLREVFSYRPVLSTQQFLQTGFSQKKLSTLCDVITLVLDRHRQLSKPKVRVSAVHTGHRGGIPSPPSTAEIRPVVRSHMRSPPGAPQRGPAPSHDPIRQHGPAPSHDPIRQHGPAPSQAQPERCAGPDGGGAVVRPERGASGAAEAAEAVRGSPAAEEAHLHTLLSVLTTLSQLEERLDRMEKRSHTDTSEDAVTVTREEWEHLNNRVLLLETKLELNNSLWRQSPSPSAKMQD